MSTSPDCNAVKRCCAVNGTYLTLSAAPKIAADNALQTSTSKPAQCPWLSGAAKPAMPVGTPQLIWPACLTLSSVGPAFAVAPNPSPLQPTTSAPTHRPIVIANSLPAIRRRIIPLDDRSNTIASAPATRHDLE